LRIVEQVVDLGRQLPRALDYAAGEILVTREAMEMIPTEAGITAREINISISGVSIPAYVVQYRET